jgi:hypothetical protein
MISVAIRIITPECLNMFVISMSATLQEPQMWNLLMQILSVIIFIFVLFSYVLGL